MKLSDTMSFFLSQLPIPAICFIAGLFCFYFFFANITIKEKDKIIKDKNQDIKNSQTRISKLEKDIENNTKLIISHATFQNNKTIENPTASSSNYTNLINLDEPQKDTSSS